VKNLAAGDLFLYYPFLIASVSLSAATPKIIGHSSVSMGNKYKMHIYLILIIIIIRI
jgi:hypothetical protein